MSDARGLAIAFITLAYGAERQKVRKLLDRLREDRELRRLVLGVWLGGRLVDDVARASRGRDAAPVVPATPLDGPEALTEPATAEDRVAAYLLSAPSGAIKDAAAATGLTHHKITKTAAWKDHEERVLAEFLETHPGANITDVRHKFGWSKGKISGMGAWKARMEKKAERSVPASKERQLDDRSLKVRSDGTFENAERAETAREQFWVQLLAVADRNQAGLGRRLGKLGSDDRERLLNHLVSTASDLEGNPEDKQGILLLTAHQWLDDHEQNIRGATLARPR